MRQAISRKKLYDILRSKEFKNKFEGMHLINMDNISDSTNLESEIKLFVNLKEAYEDKLTSASGRNKYMYENAVKVVGDYIKQLNYILSKYTQN